jgi:hypothetical protein
MHGVTCQKVVILPPSKPEMTHSDSLFLSGSKVSSMLSHHCMLQPSNGVDIYINFDLHCLRQLFTLNILFASVSSFYFHKNG